MNATQTMEKAVPAPLGLVIKNTTHIMEKAVPAPLGLLMIIPQMKLMEMKSITQELYIQMANHWCPKDVGHERPYEGVVDSTN